MRKQIIICFDNGKWMCDFITVNNGHTQEEILDAYMNQYAQVCKSMEIASKLLPSIIHISLMGEQK